MVVVGVTGTKGKTSACNFIWSVLTESGHKTGMITTANIMIGEKEILNNYHMTMPGRFKIQGLLKKIKKEGCKYCIVETTSEGIKQFRHKGIHYDIAVFTNLFPEHLRSHGGSFEKYKETKGKLFASIAKAPKKIIGGKKIKKLIIANYDSEHADYFLNFEADKKITFGLKEGADFRASNVRTTDLKTSFTIKNDEFVFRVPGEFNVENALAAIAVCSSLGISNEDIKRGLISLASIPGRMEEIENNLGIKIFVDYAHQKESMYAVLNTAQNIKKSPENKVLVLLGAEGGGRDKTKRPAMGEAAAKLADYVIISNVDPYKDDPVEIAEDIAKSAENHGKIREQNLFVIEDRREGIKKILSLASPGDIVLITGKGSEQSITIDGIVYPWDDRKITREELEKL